VETLFIEQMSKTMYYVTQVYSSRSYVSERYAVGIFRKLSNAEEYVTAQRKIPFPKEDPDYGPSKYSYHIDEIATDFPLFDNKN